MKNADFLANLKIEIKDANSGIGKTYEDIQSYQTRIGGILSSIEGKIDSVVNNDSYKISDIHINVEDKEIFRSVILDLESKKIIMQKEDFIVMKYPSSMVAKAINESRSIIRTTRTLDDLVNGKNTVVVDKKKFRAYAKEFKKITSDVQISNITQDNEDKGNDLNKIKLTKIKEKTLISYEEQKIVTLGSETHMVKLIWLFKKNNSWDLDIQPVFFKLYKGSKSKHCNVTSIKSMKHILAQTKIRDGYFRPIKYKISLGFPSGSTIRLLVKKVK
jgi:hypothetical protein